MAERKIGNETYRCSPMPAGDALVLLADLTRVASHGAGRLPAMLLGIEEKASGADPTGDYADMAFIAGIGDVLAQNASRDIAALVERIVTKAEIRRPSGYDKVSLDDDFTGNLEAIVPVARFVLEVQYRDFFGASGVSGALTRFQALFRNAR